MSHTWPYVVNIGILSASIRCTKATEGKWYLSSVSTSAIAYNLNNEIFHKKRQLQYFFLIRPYLPNLPVLDVISHHLKLITITPHSNKVHGNKATNIYECMKF